MPFTFEDSMIHCMILQFTPRTTVCCILYRFHLSSMIALHVLALRHFLSHNPHILPLYVHALHVDCGVPLPEPYVWDPILFSTWQLHEPLLYHTQRAPLTLPASLPGFQEAARLLLLRVSHHHGTLWRCDGRGICTYAFTLHTFLPLAA